MHEMSIAESLIELVKQHIPDQAVVLRVHVRAGAMRGIEPSAMQWAWGAAVQYTDWPQAELKLECLPWRLRCLKCDEVYDAQELDTPCPCGHEQAMPQGGDELLLMSIEVEPRHKEAENAADTRS